MIPPTIILSHRPPRNKNKLSTMSTSGASKGTRRYTSQNGGKTFSKSAYIGFSKTRYVNNYNSSARCMISISSPLKRK